MFHHTMVSMGMSIGQPYTFYSIGRIELVLFTSGWAKLIPYHDLLLAQFKPSNYLVRVSGGHIPPSWFYLGKHIYLPMDNSQILSNQIL